jgi:hypothetical protein
MNTEQIKDMQLLYSAVYNEELREQFDEYNTAIYVEEWVNQLVEEGYDLSEYTWDDMVEIYNEQFTLGKKKKFTLGNKKTPEELARYVAALKELQGNNEEPTTQSQSSGGPTRRRRTNLNDVQVREDIYDTILSHLIDEGYAESVEQAEVIMVNMSEDWRESIVEKFSMAADTSKPQSPKRTKLPPSREKKIGPHDDWQDKPTEWGELSPAAKKLRSRAITVTGTRRREDKETGVR